MAGDMKVVVISALNTIIDAAIEAKRALYLGKDIAPFIRVIRGALSKL